MNKAMPARQRGLSFSGFIVGAFILVIASLTGLRLAPAYMQDAKISAIFAAIASDPEMQKASPHDIRLSFSKRASVDNITAIKPEDIDVANNGGRLTLSASYDVRVPLVANASLYLEFNPTSAQ